MKSAGYRLLIVEDDEQLRNNLARALAAPGVEVSAADGGQQGVRMLKEHRFDIVITDLQMPEVDGFEVLRFTRTLAPPPAVIVLSGYGTIQVAIEATRVGAYDFLEKPVSMHELKGTIESILHRDDETVRSLTDTRLGCALAGSPEWLEPFMAKLQRIARTDATVLIQGETGTGKSAVAKEIWKASPRARKQFVEVNCAAIPEQLLESELFGHVKGAFTGATNPHIGRAEQANGGTLFLDEIGELKIDLQAKLLHLLQEGIFQPVGSAQTKSADVRFIAATNRDLWLEVKEKGFRADLYYRLNVVDLTVPPLRERQADIPVLVRHFSERVARKMATDVPDFGAEAIELLLSYPWPGNVRELENLVERMAILYPGQRIRPEHFADRFRHEANGASRTPPPRTATPVPEHPIIDEIGLGAGFDLNDAIRKYETDLIRSALSFAEGNKSKAAKLLNMKRTTLLEKLKKLKLDQPTEQ